MIFFISKEKRIASRYRERNTKARLVKPLRFRFQMNAKGSQGYASALTTFIPRDARPHDFTLERCDLFETVKLKD
jgi:hypothetical protein